MTSLLLGRGRAALWARARSIPRHGALAMQPYNRGAPIMHDILAAVLYLARHDQWAPSTALLPVSQITSQ
jgi:hypothetical protein